MCRDRPQKAAPGYPWSWRGCYWNHEPQTEVELLTRGFHIAYVAPDSGRQGKAWDRWYKFLTEEHGLSKKVAFIGMSKGGVNAFNWGVVNPDKVACIYADNPALYDEDFAKVPELAKHDVPLLHICGTEDMLLQRHTLVVENMYHQLGGAITVIVKEGHAHHPHSLQNAKPIADWIVQHMQPSTANRPAFVDANFTKSYYYSLEPSFIYLKEEQTYATGRGPGFTESYDRYDASRSGTFRSGGMAIIVPRNVAAGKPWVFRADAIDRNATVDLALLAKGFHIVTPPSPAQSGMVQQEWDETYKIAGRQWILEEAGDGRDRGERGRGVCLGNREPGQGFLYLCPESLPAQSHGKIAADRQPGSAGQSWDPDPARLRQPRPMAE